MTTVVSGAQIAAARALTGVSQARLAARAGLDLQTLRQLEANGHGPLDVTAEVESVLRALDDFGVLFIDDGDGFGSGVRLKFSRKEAKAIGAWEDEGGIVGDDDVP
ncbi:helix-turn-helix domain-containing protein [Phenylobacterium sp.]|uniref:helix-turn-helix domain-containing protein n=1 Tax=Phenylobacterium sp. TaxID=1871053 RepID=UPI0028A25302|nr:helix-turn-helix domain-containing protein [Phenylobacterium sp.]